MKGDSHYSPEIIVIYNLSTFTIAHMYIYLWVILKISKVKMNIFRIVSLNEKKKNFSTYNYVKL